MTTDLWMLAWTAIFCIFLFLPYGLGRMQLSGGMAWAAGNRETSLEGPPWIGRAVRAHENLIANLAPFAALVLVAHVAGKANGATAFGATLFFWARVAHAAIYIAGLVYWRTLAFLIFAQLF
jgi:uncharacterized MAPEG superfamily protein